MSEYFRLRLATMPLARKGTVRVVGLAIGVDFGNEAYCEKVAGRCRKAGLLVSPEGRPSSSSRRSTSIAPPPSGDSTFSRKWCQYEMKSRT
jgi:hypothetical protein